jgi:hypothetical protein
MAPPAAVRATDTVDGARHRVLAHRLGMATLVVAAAGALAPLWRRTVAPAPHAPTPAAPQARALHASAALLAASVLADSALEHYRGQFENPGMAAPLLTSLLAMLAGAGGAAASGRSRFTRDEVYLAAVAVGAAGSAFHLYNVLRRPGGLSWPNLFYAAPIGAPAALALSGLIGLAAQRVGTDGDAPRLFGLPAGRVLSALTGVGLAGTSGEAGLLHFRGAFQNPFMWLPVTVPPLAAALMLAAALGPARAGRRWFTRAWLALTGVLGVGGVGFHAYGVHRQMGGWRNTRQNLLSGPPLPAPPSFSALALAGLATLSLQEKLA